VTTTGLFAPWHPGFGLIVLVSLLLATAPAAACTSFVLDTDDGLFFVHSLNYGSIESLAGSIYCNPRHVWKSGYSFADLLDPGDDLGPDLIWRAEYGSVTFSPFGLEMPDGGLNEAGLFIWEMGFDTEYSTDETLPVLFQTQWMQYQLDNFTSVAEVLVHLDRVALDGWGWHYFVADGSGDAAIIDYVDGRPVVTSGRDLPLPICCNSDYATAMEWLGQHRGFGGELEIEQNFGEIPRFIYGAKLLRDYAGQDPVTYGMEMLDAMSVNVRWSVVFDLTRQTAHFRTNLKRDVRHFRFSTADFAPERGARMLDIECPVPGNVGDEFRAWDGAADSNQMEFILDFILDDGGDHAEQAEKLVDRLRYRDLGAI